jgi:CRP-like cAMP-binding protein
MNPTQRREALVLLERDAWLASLPGALRERVLSHATVRSYASGQAIDTRSDSASGLAAVLEGHVSLLRHAKGEAPLLVHVAGPGCWIGEPALSAAAAPLLSAHARDRVRVLLLTGSACARIAAGDPRFATACASLVLERYRFLLRLLDETIHLSPDQRLRRRLVELADACRERGARDGAAVQLDLSQSELAGIIGLSRQRLNAQLRKLEDEGWLELGSRRIHVLHPARLRATTRPGGGR